jgi:hypothetical protein
MSEEPEYLEAPERPSRLIVFRFGAAFTLLLIAITLMVHHNMAMGQSSDKAFWGKVKDGHFQFTTRDDPQPHEFDAYFWASKKGALFIKSNQGVQVGSLPYTSDQAVWGGSLMIGILGALVLTFIGFLIWSGLSTRFD